MRAIEESFLKLHVKVLTMIKRAQQSLHRMDDIALKPKP